MTSPSSSTQATQKHPSEATAKELRRYLNERIGAFHVGFVGRLATFIGDQQIQYMSAHIQRGTQLDGIIVVFTDEYVFHQTSRTAERGGVELEVSVARRGSLLQLTSSGHENVRRDPFGGQNIEWPWPMPVKLVYKDLPSFNLPLSLELWGDDADGLRDLLPSLLRDLSA